MRAVSRLTQMVACLIVAGGLGLVAGCGGGGGDNSGFAFTPGTAAGDQYAGNYWPTDVGRWWEYDTTTQIRGSGGFAGVDDDYTGSVDMEVRRRVAVSLDTGPVQASEFRVDGLQSASAGTLAAASAPGFLGQVRQAALTSLRRSDGALQPAQMGYDIPNLSYFAASSAGVEKVAYGYSWRGSPQAIASPRSYIPSPLVAQAPRAYGWQRAFGCGNGTQADALAQELRDLGMTGQMSFRFGVAGQERVTTPTGTFDAVRVHQTVTFSFAGRAGERANGTLTSRMWLAEGIGDVAEDFTLTMNAAVPGEGSGVLTLSGDSALTDYGS